MSATIDYLPVWKKGATPEERLLEMAAIARKHPERFSKMLLVYQEDDPANERMATNYACHGCTTTELLGLLRLAENEILKQTGAR